MAVTATIEGIVAAATKVARDIHVEQAGEPVASKGKTLTFITLYPACRLFQPVAIRLCELGGQIPQIGQSSWDM